MKKLKNFIKKQLNEISNYDIKKYADDNWEYTKYGPGLHNKKYNATIYAPYDIIKDEDRIYDDEHIPYSPDGKFVIQTSKWKNKEQRIQDEEQNFYSFKTYNAALNFIPKLKNGSWFKK